MFTELSIEGLNTQTAGIVTRKYIDYAGERYEVGVRHRKLYINSEAGREELLNELREPYYSAVMAVWGDSPTVLTEGDGGENGKNA